MPKYLISIANRQRVLRIDRRRLMRLVKSLLALERVASAEVSVAFVDDSQIHEINRDFLKHDYPTDVISFLLDGHAREFAGEVVISAETAVSNARKHHTTPEDELALYLVHGLLHLCGYDDLTTREKRRMRRREAVALKSWNDSSKRTTKRRTRNPSSGSPGIERGRDSATGYRKS